MELALRWTTCKFQLLSELEESQWEEPFWLSRAGDEVWALAQRQAPVHVQLEAPCKEAPGRPRAVPALLLPVSSDD